MRMGTLYRAEAMTELVKEMDEYKLTYVLCKKLDGQGKELRQKRIM